LSSSSSSTTTTADPDEAFLANQYKEKIIELAQKEKYIIPILVVVNDNKKYYSCWEDREYTHHKILAADYEKVKEMTTEDFHKGDMDKVMELYQFLAMCYLRMTLDEFQRSDWGTTRAVLDACQFRTAHSPADLSRGLYEFFHLELTNHLTRSDYDMLRMFRLWTGKAQTKPWEYNGGFIYEEDLNTLLKMEELQVSGDNYKAKKEQAKKEGGSVGEDGVVHRKATRIRNR